MVHKTQKINFKGSKKIKKTRKTRKTVLKKDKNISREQYDTIEYPYYNLYTTKTKLFSNFKKLKHFRPKIIYKNPTKHKINKYNFKNRNGFVIFEEDYRKYNQLYEITDYFSHKCRVTCVYNTGKNTDLSVLDNFTKNKSEIYDYLNQKYGKVSYYLLKEYLYKKYKQCTTFNTTVVMSVLKFFKPNKWLDMSAGWGDRLIGAIAYGCQYTGVDPSKCMNPVYQKIIKTLAPKSKQDQYNIIKDGFENTDKLKTNYYDLVFSSPPFFDLEIYETADSQSIKKFNSLDKWLNGFLYPSIKKSYTSLVKGGHLALYISDYSGVSYVSKMKKYIKEELTGFEYVGDLHWWNVGKKGVVRTILVWRKISN